MRAVVITEPGGPGALAWQDVPDPAPAPDEVVLDVVATAVNPADILQRQGRYPPPPGAPPWLGLECSGTVSAIGSSVTGWSIGDQACALLAGGGYAEKVAVPAGQLLPVPRGLDLLTAAALPEVFCTVWSNVFMIANLQPGEVLLVHGGAGGVGTAAIQLGRAVGATVAVTAGSAEKLARCASLGATVLANYRTDDFVDVVRSATDGGGADVILDVVGAAYLERNVGVLAASGRLVVIGLQGRRKAELDLSALMAKRAALIATTLRNRPAAEKATIVAAVREHVWPLLESGDVRPVVDRVLPISSVAEAHRVVEAHEHVGKVLLTV
ncbi:MAG: NAD(P)H-quinone oxidoreductase [Jiangellaceae bacterium]|nr:NAD(P)H-quinone oxidoreductase [Jiangellaceae bacterium]